MAQPSDIFKITKGYKHALSKSATEANKYVFEELYKSAHSTRKEDVWGDFIAYCETQLDADNFTTTNSNIVKKYTLQNLTPIPGTNNEAYYINDGGNFIKPWIAPTDVPNNITAAPSYGFEAKLYKSDNSIISPTSGVWTIDYYAGVVLFQTGYTPLNLGYGIPKITCYTYIGKSLKQVLDDLIFGLVWQNPVNSRSITDPSTLTPINGERYIVGIGSIGDWIGHDNEIAVYNSLTLSWDFVIPQLGYTLLIIDENEKVNWNGTDWVIVGGAMEIIDDMIVSLTKTWSSSKIKKEIIKYSIIF